MRSARADAPKTEVNAEVVLREVASAAADFVYLPVLSGDTGHARANAAAIGFHANGLNPDPMILRLRLQLQHRRKRVHVVDDDLSSAVVIEIAQSNSASAARLGDGCACCRGNIEEAAIAHIAIENAWLEKGYSPACFIDLGVDMTIGNKQIGPAIVVEIGEAAAPPDPLCYGRHPPLPNPRQKSHHRTHGRVRRFHRRSSF